ncbi:MAG: amidohydrolase family protein [Pseudomonadota bacterium]
MIFLFLKLNSGLDEFKAQDVFKMVTQNGARAYGFQNKIGKIKDGFLADLTFVNKNDLDFEPIINTKSFSNLLHNVLINCNREKIEHVMINGEFVLKDKKFLSVCEDDINDRVSFIHKTIKKECFN